MRPATLAVALAMLGCGPRDSATDSKPGLDASAGLTPRSPPKPEPDQASDARKRECVAALTAGADPRLHTLLRSLCAESIEAEIPGVALAIAEPGKPTIHVEFGVRCFGEALLVEAATRFRIGSVSKPITAALCLSLVADETLTLATTAEVIPGFTSQAGLPPPKLDGLLRHRSGLGEIEPEQLVERDGAWLPALAASPAAGPVGDYHYSNAGFSVIGAMLEHASGRPYAQLLAERVAGPLELSGMTTDVDAQETACGHLGEDPDRHPIRVASDLGFMPGDPSWMIPAGGVLSSASEVAAFAVAIGTDALPGTAAMLEPGLPLPMGQVHAGHRDERYGRGLRSWQLDEQTRAYGHTGNNVSFVAELLFVPGRRAIVITANSGVELPATLAAAEALLRLN